MAVRNLLDVKFRPFFFKSSKTRKDPKNWRPVLKFATRKGYFEPLSHLKIAGVDTKELQVTIFVTNTV